MAPKEPPPPNTVPFRPQRLAEGVYAGMVSTFLTHPLDVLKLRQQISPGSCNVFQFASQICKCEGLGAFYRGMTAGLLRQATYTTTRLAMYDFLYDAYAGQYKKKPIRRDKVAIGILAGLAGGLVGNPSEVVLVRRMAGGSPAAFSPLPCCHSYYHIERYRGTIDALKRIRRDDGYAGLWRGTALTLLRSFVMSVGHVGIYFGFRQLLKKEYPPKDNSRAAKRAAAEEEARNAPRDNLILMLSCSLITAFICAVITHPIDMLKSIYQSTNQVDSVKAISNRIMICRGMTNLWKGFTPYFLRLSIHTITTFMILEEFRRRAKKKEEDEKKK